MKLSLITAIAAAGLAVLAILAAGFILVKHFEKEALTDRMFKSGGQYAIIGAIENGADINAVNSSGESILIKLCRSNLSEVNRLSINHILQHSKANVNAQDNAGLTALMRSAYLCDLKTISELLEKGANANCKDKEGKTALFHLAMGINDDDKSVHAAQMLIDKGADIKELDKDKRPCASYAKEGSELAVFLASQSDVANQKRR